LSIGEDDVSKAQPEGSTITLKVWIALKMLRDIMMNADFDAHHENMIKKLGCTCKEARFIDASVQQLVS